MFENTERLIPERFQRRAIELEPVDLLAQRRAWAAEIERAEEEHKKVSPALWVHENKAKENLQQVEEKAAEMIREAKRVYEQALRDRQRADERRDAIVDPCRGNLYATRSPKIYEFFRRLEKMRRDSRPEKEEWARTQEGREVVIASTWPSLKIAIDRINEIIVRELRAVELEALDDAELDARLKALDASIPPIQMVKLL